MHEPTQQPPVLLNSIKQSSKRLGICVAMIYKLIDQEKLATVKIGSRRMVPETELQRLAKTGSGDTA